MELMNKVHLSHMKSYCIIMFVRSWIIVHLLGDIRNSSKLTTWQIVNAIKCLLFVYMLFSFFDIFVIALLFSFLIFYLFFFIVFVIFAILEYNLFKMHLSVLRLTSKEASCIIIKPCYDNYLLSAVNPSTH